MPNSFKYDRLASNLIALGQGKELITFQNRIFLASSFRGRLFKWLYKIFPCLRPPSNALEAATKKTSQIFFKMIEMMDKVEQVLSDGLANLLEDTPFDAMRFSKAKAEFLAFTTAFGPFLKEVRKGKEPRSLPVMLQSIADAGEAQEATLFLKDLCQDLYLYEKLFDFEEVVNAPLPVDILRKMALDIAISFKEEKKIKQWISLVKSSLFKRIASFDGPLKNNLVQVRFVHRLLYLIVEYINARKKPADRLAELELIEARLMSFGLEIFGDKDAKHIAWRNQLEAGHTIDYGDKKLVIGEILSNREKDPNYPIVFATDDPGIEVVVFCSEAEFFLQEFQESILNCVLHMPEILGVSPFARAIIRRRADYNLLSRNEWTSTATLIGNHDSVLVQPILELLKSLVKQQPFTPYPLEPDQIGFSQDGEMRTLQCLVPVAKSFEVLEEFAFKCSRGNDAVFSHLVVESGLGETDEAHSYQELFAAAINGSDPTLSIHRCHTIKDRDLLQKRALFFDAVKKHLEEGMQEIFNRYDVPKKTPPEQVRKLLGEQLITYQRRRCPGSIFTKMLRPQAINYTCSALNLKLKQSFLDEARAKLIATFKRKGTLETYHFFDAGIFHSDQLKLFKKEFGLV